MFKKGDYIIYGTVGVCEVTDITTLNMEGAKKDRLYYVLCPRYDKSSKLFTPVDNEKIVMRPILTKEEACELVDEIPEIEALWTANDKMREEMYKEVIKSGSCRELIKIIKALYLRKKARIEQGKKTTSMDERYLKIAEDNLYSELSVPLGIPRENMVDYISDRIGQLETDYVR